MAWTFRDHVNDLLVYTCKEHLYELPSFQNAVAIFSLRRRRCHEIFWSAARTLTWFSGRPRASTYDQLRPEFGLLVTGPSSPSRGLKPRSQEPRSEIARANIPPTSTAIRGFSKTKNFFGEHNGQNVKLPQQAMAHSLMSSFNNIKRWNTKHLNTFGMDGKKKAAVSTLRPATLTWMKYLKISQPP